MVKPISPSELPAEQIAAIPDFVIRAINKLLVKTRSFTQEEAITAIIQYAPVGTTRKDVFNMGWLDFEPAYTKAGWQVTYDKPGYNETYEPTFLFSPKK